MVTTTYHYLDSPDISLSQHSPRGASFHHKGLLSCLSGTLIYHTSFACAMIPMMI